MPIKVLFGALLFSQMDSDVSLPVLTRRSSSGSSKMQVPEDDSDDDDANDSAANGQNGAGKPQAPPQLALVHVRTLKMTDDVLCARFSPNGKLLAPLAPRQHVKVFFADSLKFFFRCMVTSFPPFA